MSPIFFWMEYIKPTIHFRPQLGSNHLICMGGRGPRKEFEKNPGLKIWREKSPELQKKVRKNNSQDGTHTKTKKYTGCCQGRKNSQSQKFWEKKIQDLRSLSYPHPPIKIKWLLPYSCFADSAWFLKKNVEFFLHAICSKWSSKPEPQDTCDITAEGILFRAYFFYEN